MATCPHCGQPTPDDTDVIRAAAAAHQGVSGALPSGTTIEARQRADRLAENILGGTWTPATIEVDR